MDSQKSYTRHFKKIVANTSQIILKREIYLLTIATNPVLLH